MDNQEGGYVLPDEIFQAMKLAAREGGFFKVTFERYQTCLLCMKEYVMPVSECECGSKSFLHGHRQVKEPDNKNG